MTWSSRGPGVTWCRDAASRGLGVTWSGRHVVWASRDTGRHVAPVTRALGVACWTWCRWDEMSRDLGGVTWSGCHLVVLSLSPSVTLSQCHSVWLSPGPGVTSPCCHLALDVTRSECHLVQAMLSPGLGVSQSSCQTDRVCHLGWVSPGRVVTRSQCWGQKSHAMSRGRHVT